MTKDDQKFSEREIKRINQIQRDFFDGLIHVFDPPLPNGVPNRLKKIVGAAEIKEKNVVLDVGTGTGILIPLIKEYKPGSIYACDLSKTMLEHLETLYPFVKTIAGDIRDMTLPDGYIDVVFVNACYPNIIDKKKSFANIARMMKLGGRMVISHPMGRGFVDNLKKCSPFPLDDFPEKKVAEKQFLAHGFQLTRYLDQDMLYLVLLVKK